MIRTIIIVLALVLALTGVALAWTKSRDPNPGDSIQLPDARQEDTKLTMEPDDDGSGNPDDDGLDNTDHSDTSFSSHSNNGLSTTFSVSSLSSDSGLFRAVPRPTSVMKPNPSLGAGDKSSTTDRKRYSDHSMSLDSFDSFSFDLLEP